MKEWGLKAIKAVMPFLLKIFGVPLRDVETGEPLGRVLVFRWNGQLRIVGLKGPCVPSFQPRAEIKYWYQDLGFSRRGQPNFPSQAGDSTKKTGS